MGNDELPNYRARFTGPGAPGDRPQSTSLTLSMTGELHGLPGWTKPEPVPLRYRHFRLLSVELALCKSCS